MPARHARLAAPPPEPADPRASASTIAAYVARIDRATGREQSGPIRPEELLVHSHRDRRPTQLAAQFLASRLVNLSGNEWAGRQTLRALSGLGEGLASGVAGLFRSPRLGRQVRSLLGSDGEDACFRFRAPAALSEARKAATIEALKRDARARLAARGPGPRLRILVTGATGFFGRELLSQVADDPHVEEVVCLVRSLRERDPRTGRVRVLRAEARGAALLGDLGIRGRAARKFSFVPGDVEKPGLGLAARVRRRLLSELTHVVHGAASVSFDAPFEESYRANVMGSRHALEFSLDAQHTPGSSFVAHLTIETSYVHGRTGRRAAREGELLFPRHYYNNYYELTKAMATIEAERAMLEGGLRVVQLLPSIIIGDARTGNNHGDLKVVNAPVNAFGRVKAALDARPEGLAAPWRLRVIALLGAAFPADRSAELNLVTVDRVAQGVRAALLTPEAVGARIHLASDQRIRADEMARIVREEVGLEVRMTDPTLMRRVTRPVVTALLKAVGEDKVARSLEKLGGIFGVYSEWGQTVHTVGQDVRTLALPAHRPDARRAFRMLCRHNRYVLEFGGVRGQREVARREALWAAAVDDMEYATGRPAASLPASEFHRMLEAQVDLAGFHRRSGARARAV